MSWTRTSCSQKKNCLIYAENVAVSGKLDFRGKASFGLFCSKITVEENASIDISGLSGEDQKPAVEGDGSRGTDGKSSGKVWLFVQQLDKDGLKNLTVRAHGGRGGKGGDTPAAGKTGGAGGNGGDSGQFLSVHWVLSTYQLALYDQAILRFSTDALQWKCSFSFRHSVPNSGTRELWTFSEATPVVLCPSISRTRKTQSLGSIQISTTLYEICKTPWITQLSPARSSTRQSRPSARFLNLPMHRRTHPLQQRLS
ncbi:hypothetical protein F5X97DRAFT_240889 [Nemania serpens]|nr:hypothetical protein F5X97DRAFT_240889 [Nemania serpens]